MSFRSATKAVAAVTLLGAAAAGCSDIYLDRRETIVAHSGDALAVNRVTHTIDPWSRASANNHIAYNGEKMQVAAERYRTGRIIQPVNPTTNTSYMQSQTPPPVGSSSQSSSPPSGTKP